MKKTEAMAFRRRIESAAALQDDADALESVWMYPDYDALVAEGKTVTEWHFRFRCGGELWRTEQPTHTFDGQWNPGQPGTESLYSLVALPSEGETPDDPIPYNRNMELVLGKYYSEDGATYRCIRSTGIPVYHPLSSLIGNYVEAMR